MRCVNCGQEILEDSVFCGNCGAKVEPIMQVNPQKPKKKGLIIALSVVGGIVVLVLAVIIIMQLPSLLSKDSSGKQMAYVKDDSLYYVENVKKDKEPVEICRLDYEENVKWVYQWGEGVKLSEDGKYVYFLDRVNEDGNGELCRIKTSKISKDENKNEKNIEELGSKVLSYEILDDSEQVVYMRDGNRLMYLADREEDIAKDVCNYNLCENKVIYTKRQEEVGENYEDLYTIYAYDMKTGDNEELEDDISDYCKGTKSDFIVCKKNDGDGFSTIYVLDADGDSEIIAKNADYYWDSASDNEDKSFYYRERKVEKVSLYDCVKDSFAEKDSGITEPEYKNYYKEIPAVDAMSEWDFDYYVVRYPDRQDDFFDYLYYDNEMKMYSYYNDDDGDTYYYDELLDKWFKFDTKTYEADREIYEEAESRINLRNELKEETFEKESYDVYYYEDGKEPVLVLENIDTCKLDAENQCFIYTKAEETESNIPMEEVYSEYDVRERLESSEDALTASQYYCKWGQAEGEFEIEGADFSYDISEDGKSLMLQDTSEDRTLTLYVKKGDEIEKVEEIAEDVSLAGWSGDSCYYYEEVDMDDNVGDLCCYKNGESTKLFRNVYMSVRLYPDGNYLAFSDYNSEEGGDLKLYDAKGNDTRLAYGVTDYSYLEEGCILYLSDGDLYVYTGKDERKIDRDVIGYRCDALIGQYL